MLAPTCCETLIAVALPPWPAMSDVRSGAPLRDGGEVAHAQRRSALDDDRRVARCRRPTSTAPTRAPGAAGRFLDSARPAAAGWRPSTRRATSSTVSSAASISRRIDDDFDLARVAGQHADMADARDARQRRANHVEPVVVQVRRRQAAGQIERRRSETRPASGDRRRDRDRRAGRRGFRRCGSAPSAARRRCRCLARTARRSRWRRETSCERTRRMPGTSMIACSSGRATVSVIERAGVLPECAMTTMRGNSSGG